MNERPAQGHSPLGTKRVFYIYIYNIKNQKSKISQKFSKSRPANRTKKIKPKIQLFERGKKLPLSFSKSRLPHHDRPTDRPTNRPAGRRNDRGEKSRLLLAGERNPSILSLPPCSRLCLKSPLDPPKMCSSEANKSSSQKGLVSTDRSKTTALLSTTPRRKPRSSTNDFAPLRSMG